MRIIKFVGIMKLFNFYSLKGPKPRGCDRIFYQTQKNNHEQIPHSIQTF